MTIAETLGKWGISEKKINTLRLRDRLDGAVKFGNTWAIPEAAEKPRDERIKSGNILKIKV
jgi:hypothetical protein